MCGVNGDSAADTDTQVFTNSQGEDVTEANQKPETGNRLVRVACRLKIFVLFVKQRGNNTRPETTN